MEEIQAFVLDYLSADLPPDDVAADFNYIDGGWLDSLGVMNLVVALEAGFDIELSDDEIASDEFRTIGGLVAIVAARVAAKQVAA